MDPQVGQSLDGPSFSLSSELCNSFHGYFVPHSKKEQSIHTLVFLLLEFHVFWDPDIAISCEAMPVPGKHRSGCSQSSIGWNTGLLMKELEKVPKELMRFADL